MRIAVVAHVRHPVRPPFKGGMEAHAYHLTRALAARGHEVTLLASGDSEPGAGVDLFPVLERHYEPDFPWHRYHGTDALNDYVDAAFARAARQLLRGGYDVVHNNSLHRYPPRLARVHRVPTVTSLHVPAFGALRRAVHESAAPWSRFTATSRTHARSYWGDGELPPEAHVVHNGIDLARWPCGKTLGGTDAGDGGYGAVLWAGRIEPNKAPHLAVQAAALAGVPLSLYGHVELPRYFDAEIRPLLTDEIRYGGHVGGEELAAAMRRASAFAFTPMWDEPFGLVAIEAMASGLPVAAFDNGAAREVVGEEVGRFAASGDVAGLAEAMLAALAIPRGRARRRVEERFGIERMVDGYEAVYRAAVAGRGVAAPGVRFPGWELRVAA